MKLIVGGEIKIIFYILISIGYLFWRLYSKELRKQNERGISKRPSSSKNMEDIFKELQKTLNLPETEAPVKKEKPLPVEGGKHRLNEKYGKGHSKLKYYKPIRPSKLKKDHEMMETTYGTDDEKTIAIRPFDFDPQKAIIYSEIIKRPQY